MITKEQEAALNELECNTHLLWSKEAAIGLTKPFGFECRVSTYLANPRDPKGLMLNNGASSAEGAPSWAISGQIAIHYKLRPEGKLGRGSQVLADCDAVRKYFNED